MEYITIFEISRYDFECIPVIFYFFVAFGIFVEVVRRWRYRLVLIIVILLALLIGGIVVAMGNLTLSGEVRNEYYNETLKSDIAEGRICDLKTAGICTDGYLSLGGKMYAYERVYKGTEDYFGDRFKAIERNGQRVRITYVTGVEFTRELVILKVEMAKEDVPADKLDKLMKKYGNDKTDE